MNSNCVFCSIINRDIPAQIIYEDEDFLVFDDINPSSKIHKLIVPKKHIKNLSEIGIEENKYLWNKYIDIINILKTSLKVLNFKIVINNGDKLQLVKHLHFHFLSGDDVNDKLN